MKTSAVLIVAGIALASLFVAPAMFKRETSVQAGPGFKAFKEWMTTHNKLYATPQEHLFRFGTFLQTLKKIEQISSDKSLTYTVGLNQFSDLSEEEFLAKFTGYTPSSEIQETAEEVKSRTKVSNDNVDWRQAGAVTPVRDQGNCAAGWAFSAVAAIEGAWKLAGNALTPFSEQQLIDCSYDFGNNACNGGRMTNSFRYLTRGAKGIETDSDYPYISYYQRCYYQESKVKGIIRSYTTIAEYDCDGLLHALTNQPVSVAIAANALMFYSGGIFNNPRCGTQLNHGVTAVGYGVDANTKVEYWLVKNSWGTNWGEQGYIRLFRDDNKSEPGMCGICIDTTYPVV